jgi:hypothetical protein
MVRLVQMLGLYRLDIGSGEFKQILPPARDWIELEERRRTFWAAYYGDRWASSGKSSHSRVSNRSTQDLQRAILIRRP